MLPTELTESWTGQRVRIQDGMVIVVNAFVVKSSIMQYGSCCASITRIVHLYKEKGREEWERHRARK